MPKLKKNKKKIKSSTKKEKTVQSAASLTKPTKPPARKRIAANVSVNPKSAQGINVTEPEPVKVKKPSVEKMYFTKDTEDAIIRFNKEEVSEVRNHIYETEIQRSFEKLVENVFNTFKFSYFDTGPLEVQKETLSHLVANIHKFEEGKGKAFSYFSIVAKNYLIFNNNSNYKRYNQQVDINEDPDSNSVRLQSTDNYQKEKENAEFIEMMVKFWDANIRKIFPKQRDLKIAEAVVELFRNSDRLDYFNKKALYLYIREISSCKTQQITKIINRMKEYQQKITKKYVEEGVI
jgi:hypothetical protein